MGTAHSCSVYLTFYLLGYHRSQPVSLVVREHSAAKPGSCVVSAWSPPTAGSAAHRGRGMGAAPWQAGAIVLVSGALLAAAQQWQAAVPPAAADRVRHRDVCTDPVSPVTRTHRTRARTSGWSIHYRLGHCGRRGVRRGGGEGVRAEAGR
eukprot:COSAG01_NODE_366_length_18064_cov_35.830615_13_plen_150_part_00